MAKNCVIKAFLIKVMSKNLLSKKSPKLGQQPKFGCANFALTGIIAGLMAKPFFWLDHSLTGPKMAPAGPAKRAILPTLVLRVMTHMWTTIH